MVPEKAAEPTRPCGHWIFESGASTALTFQFLATLEQAKDGPELGYTFAYAS
jgi:hypothetical protein